MLVAQQKLKEAHDAYKKAVELSGDSIEMNPQLSSKLNDLTIAEQGALQPASRPKPSPDGFFRNFCLHPDLFPQFPFFRPVFG